MTPDERADDPVLSALGRLKFAVIAVESGQYLRPYNRRARELFAREALREDLLESRPAHPLSTYLRKLVDASPLEDIEDISERLTFPNGAIYRVEASRPSTKGRRRLLILFIELLGEPLQADAFVFTPREAEIARHLVRGATTDELCESLGMGVETLKTHLKRMFAKTNTRNRLELVAKLMGSQ